MSRRQGQPRDNPLPYGVQMPNQFAWSGRINGDWEDINGLPVAGDNNGNGPQSAVADNNGPGLDQQAPAVRGLAVADDNVVVVWPAVAEALTTKWWDDVAPQIFGLQFFRNYNDWTNTCRYHNIAL